MRFIFIFFFISLGLFAQANNNPEKETIPPKPIKEEKSPSQESVYISEYTKKLPSDMISSMLLQPEHSEAVKNSKKLWFADILRMGFHARPRFDSSENADFDKRTPDVRTVGTQNSQVWFIVDPSKYTAFKFTIQDVRIFGGSPSKREDSLGYLALNNSIGQDITYSEITKPKSTTPSTVTAKNNTDVREAFVVLKNILPNFEAKIGRQVPGFGDNRYLGARNDGQIGNSIDGVKLKWNSNLLTSEAFTSIVSEESNSGGGLNTTNGVNKGSVNDTYLSGIYNSLRLSDIVLDLFLFNLQRKWELAKNPVSSLDRSRQKDILNTAGFRLTNRTGSDKDIPPGKSLDWTIESSWQFGYTGERVDAGWDILQQKYNGKRIYTERVKYDAGLFFAQIGYTFFKKLRIGVQYVRASGDPNRSDAKKATYDASFATRSGGFPYFDTGAGLANATFWSNVKETAINIRYTTDNWGRFIFAAYDIKKYSSNDAWYGSGGTANTGNTSENYSNQRWGGFKLGEKVGKRIFYEYDLIWMKYIKEYVSIWAGTSILYAGDAIRAARTNPWASNPLDRYTLDNRARYFFFFVQFAM